MLKSQENLFFLWLNKAQRPDRVRLMCVHPILQYKPLSAIIIHIVRMWWPLNAPTVPHFSSRRTYPHRIFPKRFQPSIIPEPPHRFVVVFRGINITWSSYSVYTYLALCAGGKWVVRVFQQQPVGGWCSSRTQPLCVMRCELRDANVRVHICP